MQTLLRKGWLRKNHRGKSWATSVERFFVSDGFQVYYYAKAVGSGKPPPVKGHFDLRNVVTMQPSTDPVAAEAGAIELHVVFGPGSLGEVCTRS